MPASNKPKKRSKDKAEKLRKEIKNWPLSKEEYDQIDFETLPPEGDWYYTGPEFTRTPEGHILWTPPQK